MIETILGLSFSFLSFLIVYGMLNKIKLFEKSINVIISFVISFFVLFAFFSSSFFIVAFFSISILFLLILFIVLSAYLFKKKKPL
jgi:hypothetical protein